MTQCAIFERLPRSKLEGQLKYIEDAFVPATKRVALAGCEYQTVLCTATSTLTGACSRPDKGSRSPWPLLPPISIVFQKLTFRAHTLNTPRSQSCPCHMGRKASFVRPNAASCWEEGPGKDSDGKWVQRGIEQIIPLTGELKKLGVELIREAVLG
jgi:hypothetical protein